MYNYKITTYLNEMLNFINDNSVHIDTIINLIYAGKWVLIYKIKDKYCLSTVDNRDKDTVEYYHIPSDEMTLEQVKDLKKKLTEQLKQDEEEKTGYWKHEVWASQGILYNKWLCSECGHLEITDITQDMKLEYCPNCGAEMGRNE